MRLKREQQREKNDAFVARTRIDNVLEIDTFNAISTGIAMLYL